jgi:Leucine-rich repeat (LRR) protein
MCKDLSFNAIEEITGIERLTELEDLTLFDNRISRIGTGLSKC